MPFTLFEGALGGIGLFLFGMRLMSDGVHTVATARIRSIFSTITTNRFSSFFTGIMLAILVQSGNAAIVFVFVLLNSRVINSFQTINIVAGILVGASLSLQLEINTYNIIAPLLIFTGVVVSFFARKRSFSNWGKLCLGTGILFLGVSLLEGSYRPFNHHPLYEIFDGFFYRTPTSATIFGMLLSFLVQSAHTYTSIISTIIPTYSIAFNTGIFMVAGGVSGIAIMASLAALSGRSVARRLSLFFFIITISSGFLGIITHHFIFLEINTFSNLKTTDIYGILANIHLFVSTIAAFILVISSSMVSRIFTETDLRTKGTNELFSQSNGYLDIRILSTPTIAFEQARKEIIRMVKIVSFMYADLHASFTIYDARRAETIRQNEHILDSLNHEITSFLAQLSQTGSGDIKYEIALQLHTVSGLEHIGDRCEEILKIIIAKKETGCMFSDAAMKDIHQLAKTVSEIITLLNSSITNDFVCDKEIIQHSKKVTRSVFDKVKQNHFERISTGVCSPNVMMFFNDIISAFLRITEDCWLILEDRIRTQQ